MDSHPLDPRQIESDGWNKRRSFRFDSKTLALIVLAFLGLVVVPWIAYDDFRIEVPNKPSKSGES